MKKSIFKIASVLLSLILALTPLCAFADDEAIDEAQDNSVVLYGDELEHSIEADMAVDDEAIDFGSNDASAPSDDVALLNDDDTGFALSSASVINKDLGVSIESPLTFTYSTPVASATITLNGSSALCSVDGNVVTLDTMLEEFQDYTLEINAVSEVSGTASNTYTFSTYRSIRIEHNPWTLNANGKTELKSPTSSSTSAYALYEMPYPQLEAGEKIGKYIFRHYSSYNTSGKRYIKAPMFTDEELAGITNATPGIAEMLGLTDIPKDNQAQDSEKITSIAFSLEGYKNSHYSDVDLSTYASECYAAGKGEKFYMGYNTRWTTRIYPHNYNDLVSRGMYMYVYYTVEEADPFTLVSSTPAHGSDDSVDKKATFTFSNDITSATINVNGSYVSSTIEGNVVTADIELENYTDYIFDISAFDGYKQYLNKKIYFTTAGEKTEVKESRDGTAYHITASAAPAEVSNKKSIRRQNSNFIFFRIPVPALSDGQMLSSFTMSYVNYGGSIDAYAIKFPGDDWDVTSMKWGDENVSAVIQDYLSKGSSSQYYLYNANSSTSLGNLFYRHTFDITEYVNECIANGESYIEFGVLSSSTIDLFGFLSPYASYNKYRAHYDYTAYSPELRSTIGDSVLNGCSLEKISFNLFTTLLNTEEVLEIRTIDGASVGVMDVAFDTETQKYFAQQQIALQPNTSYEAVLKAGTQDIYGNVLDADLVIAKFATFDDIAVSVPKIIEDADSDIYDEAQAVDSVVQGSSYKAITSITNNTEDTVDVMLIVATYDESGNIADMAIKFADVPGGAQGSELVSESVDASCEVKAFVWRASDYKVMSDMAVVYE